MFMYHILALLAGTILDFFIGDPHGIWHPIVTIGKWIGRLDKILLGDKDLPVLSQKKRGYILVAAVILPVVIITAIIVWIAYKVNLYLGMTVEAILSCYCLAARSLITESKKVTDDYESKGIDEARKSLSMIVGRDTENLSIEKIIKAAVETVAENSSDGVIAPLIYLTIGGPVLGLTYKAINTMDSMVGYHNNRYEYFGTAAAHLDDAANYIPSRLTGLLAIAVSFKSLGFDRENARKIFRRDRYNHKSPNSAQSEAAFAGALGLQLGGPNYYFGKLVEKPTIGDALKEPEISDVERSHGLLRMMVYMCQIILVIILAIAYLISR